VTAALPLGTDPDERLGTPFARPPVTARTGSTFNSLYIDYRFEYVFSCD